MPKIVPRKSPWLNARHDPDDLDPEVFSADPDEVDIAPYIIRRIDTQEEEQ
jgi:hypothetical protein